jgi:lambda family phage tail tape measure protein
MATIDSYKIKIDVEGEQAVDRLKNSLSGLGGIIAGIGIGAFIHSAMEMADAVSDLSHATGVAVGTILSFQHAMAQAGGEGKNAGKAIATFFQMIDSAAQGTESAQKALQRIGINFKDVGTLSETELLNKAVKNLGEMKAGAERTAAGIAIFGKSFRDIDPSTLAEVLKSTNYDQAAAAIEKAAARVDAMRESFLNLQIAALQALEPIIGKLGEGGLKLEQAEKIVKAVGIALGVAFGVKIITTIAEIVTIIKSLNTALKGTVVVQTALIALQGPKGWAIIAAGAAAAAGAVYALNKALEETPEPTGGGRPTMKDDPRIIGSGGPARKTQFYSDAELQARKTALETAKQMTEQIKKQNVQAEYYQQTINDTIGLMDEEANRIKTNAALEQDANNKIIDLNKQIEVEKSKGRGTNQAVIAELEKQKTEVATHLEITKSLKQEEAARLVILQKQENHIRNILSVVQEQMEQSKTFSQQKLNQDVIDGKMSQEQMARRTELNNLEIDYAKKQEALTAQGLLAKSDAERQNVREQQNMAVDLYKEQVHLTKEKFRQEDELRNSSVAGYRAAYEQIARSMDPYMVAQSRVNAIWGNMSSAIDNFVDHGKFSFEDFANSVIKDLIKIELKAQAMNLWGIISGAAGGGGGGIGSLVSAGLSFLGFAEGGSPPVGKASLVGENGPELFVPKTAGTIVPNTAMGSTTNNHYNYNISAVDGQSVARLFATNRQLMLGTIEQARKETPSMTRGR